MTLLLDTHTFIWFDSDRSQLSSRALALVTDPANRVLLSVATAWEMVIKHQVGKLTLRDSIPRIVAEQVATNRIELLDINLPHVYEVLNLPLVHRDPFDRILAAQANVEGASLVSSDAIFGNYPVRVEW
ncbi:type II toxin-antitoxin system VapC family toxin [bacterium]|nr:type II toxin-antitoxin system VapC family toxin [bacterium]